MRITMFHNPKCTKSRQTLALLKERGIKPDETILYLETPPDAETIRRILKLLGLPARQLLRSKEKAYLEAGLDNSELSEETLVQAMVNHPILIERPILICGEKAALGRPPENVLSIL